MWKKLTDVQMFEIQKRYGLIGLDLNKAINHWRKLGFDYNKIVDMISAYKQGQEAGIKYASHDEEVKHG